MASGLISRELVKFPSQQLRLSRLVQEHATEMDHFKVSMQGCTVTRLTRSKNIRVAKNRQICACNVKSYGMSAGNLLALNMSFPCLAVKTKMLVIYACATCHINHVFY